MGVRRITVGASLARVALAATVRAAREIIDRGTFSAFEGVPGVADFKELMAPER